MVKAVARFERFYRVVRSGCWEWQAGHVPAGYGRFYWGGRQGYAHRFSHEAFVGPIPPGFDVDHLCRNPRCVNPEHLEAVTRRENLRRGRGLIGVNAAKTHCVNGHEFNEQNTYAYADGSRSCRPCNAAQARERRRRAS
jgi:hypothetical protein